MANLEKIIALISSYESNLVVLRKLFMTDGVLDTEEQKKIDQVEALLAKVKLEVGKKSVTGTIVSSVAETKKVEVSSPKGAMPEGIPLPYGEDPPTEEDIVEKLKTDIEAIQKEAARAKDASAITLLQTQLNLAESYFESHKNLIETQSSKDYIANALENLEILLNNFLDNIKTIPADNNSEEYSNIYAKYDEFSNLLDTAKKIDEIEKVKSVFEEFKILVSSRKNFLQDNEINFFEKNITRFEKEINEKSQKIKENNGEIIPHTRVTFTYEWLIKLTIGDIVHKDDFLSHKANVLKIFREELDQNDTKKVGQLDKKIQKINKKMLSLYKEEQASISVQIKVVLIKKKYQIEDKNYNYWGIESIDGVPTNNAGIKITFGSPKPAYNVNSDSSQIDIILTREKMNKTIIDFKVLAELIDADAPLLDAKGIKIPGIDLTKIPAVVEKIVRKEEIPEANASIPWSIVINHNPVVNVLEFDVNPDETGDLFGNLNYKEITAGKQLTFESGNTLKAANDAFEALLKSKLTN
jgi:hypothetical protein